MGRGTRRKCLNCGEIFTLDARNAHHQRYCTEPACRAASKRASQAKWLAKPENRDYFRGAQAVARVQAWRKANPGYDRRPASVPQAAPNLAMLAVAPRTEALPAPPSEGSDQTLAVAGTPSTAGPSTPERPLRQTSCIAGARPLQDVLNAQPDVLIGLIAHFLGCALQEDIASTMLRLVQLGQDIRGGDHEREQTRAGAATPARGAAAFRVARPLPGA